MLKACKPITTLSDSILYDAVNAQDMLDISCLMDAEWVRKALAYEGWLSHLIPELQFYDGEITEVFVQDILPMMFRTGERAVIHAKLRSLSNEVYVRLKREQSAEYRMRISDGLVLQEMQKIPNLRDKVSELSLFVTLIADIAVGAPIDTCIATNVGVPMTDIRSLYDNVLTFPHYFVRENKVRWTETDDIGTVVDYASNNSVFVVFEPGTDARRINEDELEYVSDEYPERSFLGYYAAKFARLNEHRNALTKTFDEMFADLGISSSIISTADAEFIRGCEEKDGNLYKDGKQLNNCRRWQGEHWYTYQTAGNCEDDWHGNIFIPTEEPGTFVRFPFETW